MPPGPTHVDVPTFRGASRDQYPLSTLIAMGASELFEQWRVIQAGVVTWFYDGPGGNFEYWPEGPGGPMLAERPPFHNVAIMADSDRMYHRIGRVGNCDAKLPRMTAAAKIRPSGREAWEIVENGEIRASYPSKAKRFSIVWKADLETQVRVEPLTLERVMDVFTADLGRRKLEFRSPTNPLSDREWKLYWKTPTRVLVFAVPSNETKSVYMRLVFVNSHVNSVGKHRQSRRGDFMEKLGHQGPTSNNLQPRVSQ